MESSLLLSLTLIGTIALIYKHVVHSIWISPLAKIPNAHPTSPIAPLWILWIRFREQENETRLKLHQKLGNIIRLGPTEISVNDVDHGVYIIHGSNFDKHESYNRFLNYNKLPTLLTTLPSDLHLRGRRMVSKLLSQSYLETSRDLHDLINHVIFDRFPPEVEDSLKAGIITSSCLSQVAALDRNNCERRQKDD